MSFWKRLFGGGAAKDTPAPPDAAAAAAEPPPAPPEPKALADDAQAEAWLGEAIARVAAAGPPPPADETFARIETLRRAGHERLAREWLDKLAAALPDSPLRDDARLRAAELAAERGELREVLDHLDALVARPSHAARAHFLLAEHHRRQGDLREALRHLEAVLALDMTFPNARVRAEALRAALGAAAAAPAATGETLAGPELGALRTARYQLIRHLGRGASGAVYLARDVELDREVAIKLLHPHLMAAAQSEARRLFFAEARVAAALRHPNVVAILDVDESGQRIVMEHAAGGTLRARLQEGPLPPLEALARHAELCSALAAAHARGIVHRDLKPANLLFRRAGAAGDLVLTDFGVAHLSGADRRGAAREPVGTLAYMAPEQRRNEPPTPAVDLHAAGVILWESLVGRLPWSADRVLGGARGERDLALPADLRARLGWLADEIEAHLVALGALDAARRPDAPATLAAARRLVDTLRARDEVDSLRQELAAFRADGA